VLGLVAEPPLVGVEDADAVGEDVIVSLLREPFVVSVTVEEQLPSAASGAATILAVGAYEVQLRFRAEHDGTAWRIAELSLPASQIRVTFAGEEWELHLPPPLRSINPLRAGHLTLPQVGVVGRAPDPEQSTAPVLVVSVTRDGEIRLRGERTALSLRELRERFRRATADPQFRNPDRSSRVALLLDVDEATPWGLCQWIMMIAAEPSVAMDRVFFGVAARETGEEGALACFLLKDVGLSAVPAAGASEPLQVTVELRPTSEDATDLGALWAALSEIPAAERADATFTLSVPTRESGHVPAAAVLGVVDLLQQAGAGYFAVQGERMPSDRMWDDATAITSLVQRARAASAKAVVSLNGEVVTAEPIPLPASAAVDRYVGFGYGLGKHGEGVGEAWAGRNGVGRIVAEDGDER
jgi:hypothetical protein